MEDPNSEDSLSPETNNEAARHPATEKAASKALERRRKSQQQEKDAKDQELIRLALRKSPFFTCLDEEQMERFVRVAAIKRYASGQSIILEGCVDDAEMEHDERQQHDSDHSLQALMGGGRNIEQQQIMMERGATALSSADQEVSSDETKAKVKDDSFALVEKSDELAAKHAEADAENELRESEANNANIQVNSSPENAPTVEDQDPSFADTDNNNQSTPSAPSSFLSDDPSSAHYLEPPPPKSGVPSYIYIIRSGQADVMYSKNNVKPASLGTGTVFGEGGFLFGRQHSASVLAASGVLECYVVDAMTFRNYVLPSDNMTKLYNQHARHVDSETNIKYMTMQDFVNSCLGRHNNDNEEELSSLSSSKQNSDEGEDHPEDAPLQDPLASVRIANTFNILRNDDAHGSTMFTQKISLADFCLFHLLMARPDPEVDITFLLIDVHKRGVLYKDDIASFLKSSSLADGFEFDMDSEFIHRHFGKENKESQQRGIRPHQFSQFLVDLRREIGQQVFLQEVERTGTAEGYISPSNFVRILKTACGWRLPDGVADRIGSIYLADSKTTQSNLVGEVEDYSVQALSKSDEDPVTENRIGDQFFSYCDFLAYQEVLSQLPGICNLIGRACEIKKGAISPDDFKVANRVLGMGGSLSRRQVDLIFQLFDLDGDGYVSHEDTITVAGVEIAQRIDAVAGRQGALTFAPPPKFRDDDKEYDSRSLTLRELFQNFCLTSFTGTIGIIALAPLDLVKTRLMNERVAIQGPRMYKNAFDCLTLAVKSEGYLGLYRGLLPQLIGVGPEKFIKLAVNDLVHQSLGPPKNGPNETAVRFMQDMLAGGCAGACQLLVTNPVSLIKAVV